MWCRLWGRAAIGPSSSWIRFCSAYFPAADLHRTMNPILSASYRLCCHSTFKKKITVIFSHMIYWAPSAFICMSLSDFHPSSFKIFETFDVLGTILLGRYERILKLEIPNYHLECQEILFGISLFYFLGSSWNVPELYSLEILWIRTVSYL